MGRYKRKENKMKLEDKRKPFEEVAMDIEGERGAGRRHRSTKRHPRRENR